MHSLLGYIIMGWICTFHFSTNEFCVWRFQVNLLGFNILFCGSRWYWCKNVIHCVTCVWRRKFQIHMLVIARGNVTLVFHFRSANYVLRAIIRRAYCPKWTKTCGSVHKTGGQARSVHVSPPSFDNNNKGAQWNDGRSKTADLPSGHELFSRWYWIRKYNNVRPINCEIMGKFTWKWLSGGRRRKNGVPVQKELEHCEFADEKKSRRGRSRSSGFGRLRCEEIATRGRRRTAGRTHK